MIIYILQQPFFILFYKKFLKIKTLAIKKNQTTTHLDLVEISYAKVR